MKPILHALSAVLLLTTVITNSYAQGTAFTYQGRLFDGTNAANGKYDLRFNVYDAAALGSLIAGPVTNTAVPVTNGLFTVNIDFGAGVFAGAARWLEIGVRSNTVAVAFTPLTQRQQLTPTPYSIYAETASAAGLSGTLPVANLPAVVVTNGASGTNLTGLALLAGGNTFQGNQSVNGRLTINTGASSSNYTDLVIGPGGYYVNEQHSINFDDGLGHIGSLGVGYDGANGYMTMGNLYTSGIHPSNTSALKVFGNGSVNVDPMGMNAGFLNNGNTNSSGLTFGASSGEGIASKRTAGGNQFGLDFYTANSARLSIDSTGDLLIPSPFQTIIFPATTTNNSPMIEMFASGTQNSDRMVIAHSPSFPNWGLQYQDSADRFNFLGNGNPVMSIDLFPGSVGIGVTNPSAAAFEVASGDVRIDNHELFLTQTSTTNNGSGIGYRNFVSGTTGTNYFGIAPDGPFIYGYNGGCLGGLGPTTIALSWDYRGNIWVSNNCSVGTLTIRGGADLAEPFNISADSGGEVPQGAVVVIDEENPGHLKLSNQPYDTHVAGVVSGANGVNPGIQMHQQGLVDGGKNVALTGRVYVQADASNGVIKPGDLLTTSSTPGYAMKVSDHSKAAGAILGKAMTGLKDGKGMVLVLVSLQ